MNWRLEINTINFANVFYVNKFTCTNVYSRGVVRILGKGVLEYACKILSHAHLLTVQVEVQIVKENAF